MRSKLFPAFMFFFMVASLVKPGNKMEKFEWLNGSWTMKTKRGTIMESWQRWNDSLLIGESVMISPTGQSNVSENLKLAYEGGKYYYISRVKGQNNGEEVKFEITSYSEKDFTAENPGHDFPKRISYELVNKDSIHAFIDDGASGSGKKSDFYYSRMK